MHKIPFSPPFINQEIIDEVTDSLKSGWITTGPKVKALEQEVAKLTNVENALCINSATSGLMLALKWFGVGEGDEVIIPAYTYAATALAVLHVGATPVMVDSNNDFNISIDCIKKAINSKTKVIIPVDIAGWPCDYDSINSLVNEFKDKFISKGVNQSKLGRILVLSDAAHSVGASYKGKSTGNLTDISVFSFHAVKNITTAEGGVVCLNLPHPFNNAEEYNFLRCFSLNGQTKDAFTKSKAGGWRYDIIHQGMKINMPDVLAAIGLVQIRMYDSSILIERERVFCSYNEVFKGKQWAELPPSENRLAKSSFHLYALRIKNCSEFQRDQIIDGISKRGVAVNVHFQPLPKLTLFKELGYNIDHYPVANSNYEREISLPIYPQLTNEQINYIIEVVIDEIEKIICK